MSTPTIKSIGDQKLVFLVLMLSLTACSTFRTARHYQDETKLPCPSDALKLSAFTVPPPPSKAPGIAKLSDHGQAALVKALADTTEKDAAKLLSLAAQPMKKPAPSTVDLTRLSRRVILSFATVGLDPANRVTEVDFKINIDPIEGSSFHNWSRIDSEFASVNLGKVTSISGLSASSLTIAGNNLAPGITRTLQEELTLKRTYASLTGVLEGPIATVYQKGSVDRPLGGNIVIDVELDLANLRAVDNRDVYVDVTELRGLNTSVKTDDGVAWSRYLPAKIPSEGENVCRDYRLRVEALARLRIVDPESGGKTIVEGDDKVDSCEVPLEAIVTKGKGPELVHWADLKFTTWMILWKGKGYLAINLIAASGAPSPAKILDMSNEKKAYSLLSWLWTHGSTNAFEFGQRAFRLCNSDALECRNLVKDDLADLKIEHQAWNYSGEECEEPVSKGTRKEYVSTDLTSNQ